MYIADFGNHRIQKLTTEGKFFHKFGKKESGQEQLNYPCGVVVDSKKRVIVSEMGNNRVQVFSHDGNWLLIVYGAGSLDNYFQSPRGLALDPQGNVAAGGDVKYPSGVAVDAKGYSFFSEYDGDCFSIFDPKGQKILNKPRRLALDPLRSSLYVSNGGTNSVLKYTL